MFLFIPSFHLVRCCNVNFRKISNNKNLFCRFFFLLCVAFARPMMMMIKWHNTTVEVQGWIKDLKINCNLPIESSLDRELIKSFRLIHSNLTAQLIFDFLDTTKIYLKI